MAPIWAELLGLPDADSFDHDESFFDLGGHSLLASKLVAALNSRLESMLAGRFVTVLDLFDSPSLRALAVSLAPAATEVAPSVGLRAVPPSASGRVDLAIIGHAGHFPGAPTIEALWAMLYEGRDALTMWSPSELVAKGVPADVRHHPDFVPAAYMLHGAQYFDAAFWGISPAEAKLMDPQHRLFMQVAWAALEDAGYAPRAGTPPRTAVFASPGIDGYMIHHLKGEPLKDTLQPGTSSGGRSEKDYISTRVSYARPDGPLSRFNSRALGTGGDRPGVCHPTWPG